MVEFRLQNMILHTKLGWGMLLTHSTVWLVLTTPDLKLIFQYYGYGHPP